MSNVPYKKYLSFNYFIIICKTFLLYNIKKYTQNGRNKQSQNSEQNL